MLEPRVIGSARPAYELIHLDDATHLLVMLVLRHGDARRCLRVLRCVYTAYCCHLGSVRRGGGSFCNREEEVLEAFLRSEPRLLGLDYLWLCLLTLLRFLHSDLEWIPCRAVGKLFSFPCGFLLLLA